MDAKLLVTALDGLARCAWCAADPELSAYHDREWGFPVDDDVRLFEKVCLEGFQAGLSWRTILAKRAAFRVAFCGFDFYRVAHYDARDVADLMQNKGIVRHHGKIESVINNAARAVEMVAAHGSLAAYFWRYEPDPVHLPTPQTVTTCRSAMDLSKDLKALGWTFIGPTTMFALMQAMGMVNDHVHGCITREKVDSARQAFKRPNDMAEKKIKPG